MSEPAEVHELIQRLSQQYGPSTRVGRSRLLRFGSALTCSLNYSKLLGHRFFFGLATEIVDPTRTFPATSFGDFVILLCGSANTALVLPRSLVLEMMQGVSSRRIDILLNGASYIMQTTGHRKLDVTEYLNSYPIGQTDVGSAPSEPEPVSLAQRDHVRLQWSLIRLGMAEGCSVWVPPNDRNLSFNQSSFADHTLPRLPGFGFDEQTRRIIQNIDVLWLTRNVIHKAFEIEATTSIYSGLLRLNDLALAQPNNQIELFVAAPTARREAVRKQLSRPSFHALASKCMFVAFEAVDAWCRSIDGLPLDRGARVSGLLTGERLEPPDWADSVY